MAVFGGKFTFIIKNGEIVAIKPPLNLSQRRSRLEELLEKLGTRFRKLVLHSDGTWVATSHRDYEKTPNKPGIGIRGNTPHEALRKLLEILE